MYIGALCAVECFTRTGPPFRGSAIPGVRVSLGLGLGLWLTLADLRNGGPESFYMDR